MILLLLGVVVVAGIVLLVLAGAVYQAFSERRDRERYPPPGSLVDVGGYRLQIDIQGDGAPTVVLDAGGGRNSVDWSIVQPRVAEFARVCSYDRAGHGWSDPGPRPRTSGRNVDELDTLLDRAGIEGPYVLVGHSFGGMIARLYASLHPEKVAGIVLVDSAHEDWGKLAHMGSTRGRLLEWWRMQLYGLRPVFARLGLLRLKNLPNGAGESLPLEVQPVAKALGLQSRAYDWLIGLGSDAPESEAQLRSAPPLPDIPLVVLSSHITHEPWGVPAEDADQYWIELQTGLAGSVPNGTLTISEEGGHMLHLDDPRFVVDSIRQVVEAARAASQST